MNEPTTPDHYLVFALYLPPWSCVWATFLSGSSLDAGCAGGARSIISAGANHPLSRRELAARGFAAVHAQQRNLQPADVTGSTLERIARCRGDSLAHRASTHTRRTRGS